MSEELKWDRVTHPDGRVFKVSTIRTLAGGAGATRSSIAPMFTDTDYADETPWPYETMVFKDIGAAGQYHAPSASREAALAEHVRVVALIRGGLPFEGVGVQGFWGNPSTTREMWFARPKAKGPRDAALAADLAEAIAAANKDLAVDLRDCEIIVGPLTSL